MRLGDVALPLVAGAPREGPRSATVHWRGVMHRAGVVAPPLALAVGRRSDATRRDAKLFPRGVVMSRAPRNRRARSSARQRVAHRSETPRSHCIPFYSIPFHSIPFHSTAPRLLAQHADVRRSLTRVRVCPRRTRRRGSESPRLVRSFVRSIVRSFTRSLARSLVRSFFGDGGGARAPLSCARDRWPRSSSLVACFASFRRRTRRFPRRPRGEGV